ncbi:hypothetical protein TeGR_g13223 [Tetraparma gracilis]|nr:hypothetical protein TeGR_g13223 [Tetraparma gracilis]
MVMMAAPDPVQSMLAMDESRLKATIAEGAARRSLGETMAATTAATTAETTAVTTPASVSPAQAEAPMQIDPASITTTTTTTTTTSSSTTSATTTSTSSPPPPPQRSVAIAAKGAKVDDSDYGAFIKGHVHEREAFGDTIKRVGSDELASMSVEERQAFNWHQANLEMSCGINLDNIGREWNEDEPYGFEGEHVLLHEGYSALMSAMADGLDIRFDTLVQSVETWDTWSGKKRDYDSGDNGSEEEIVPVGEGAGEEREEVDEGAAERRSSRKRDPESFEYGDLTTKSAIKVRPEGGVTVVTNKGEIDADVCIVTAPLGVLKRKVISFSPPLPKRKQLAIDRMGFGCLNKCAITFPHKFWDSVDFVGHCAKSHGENVLFTCVSQLDDKPVLCFMFGGDFSADVEKDTDKEVLGECLAVLRKIYKECPEPVDYYVSRWQSDAFARGSFCFVPPGVTGEEHAHLEMPLCDKRGDVRVMFAGEHTNSHHPSTVHGAYLSGIREAYRIDLSYNPERHSHGVVFNPKPAEPTMYRRTFRINKKLNKEKEDMPRVLTWRQLEAKEKGAREKAEKEAEEKAAKAKAEGGEVGVEGGRRKRKTKAFFDDDYGEPTKRARGAGSSALPRATPVKFAFEAFSAQEDKLVLRAHETFAGCDNWAQLAREKLGLDREPKEIRARLDAVFKEFKLQAILNRGQANRSSNKSFQKKLAWRGLDHKDVWKGAKNLETNLPTTGDRLEIYGKAGAGGASHDATVNAQYSSTAFLVKFDRGGSEIIDLTDRSAWQRKLGYSRRR